MDKRTRHILTLVTFIALFCITFVNKLSGQTSLSQLVLPNKTSVRLHNIDLMFQVLKKGEYIGYDIIIISSTTQEEADYQQQILEKIFSGTTHPNGQAPIILSVVDLTEGGQLLGSIFTWFKAEEKMKENYPHLLNDNLTLLKYAREAKSKIAIFHNGGKGERCSPLTQSLGNSRGAQKLVGEVTNAQCEKIQLEVLIGVILQCSSFATTNCGTHIDTFWTSQIAFGSNPHNQLIRSNFGLDKFLVGFDKRHLIASNIIDFGTAALSKNGRMMAFYGNKRFASRKRNSYVIDQAKIDIELFSKGDRFAYDFGSFSCSFDLWDLIIDYWKRKNVFSDSPTKQTQLKMKRDIDPHFIQPLVRCLYALNDMADRNEIDKQLPNPALLNSNDSLQTALEEFNMLIKTAKPEAHVFIWEEILQEKDPKKKAEAISSMNEAIEFYLLYRQTRPFLNLTKVFGYIDLGNDTQWFRYRRPIDIMNEKFEMLTDLIGKKIEMQFNGSVQETNASEDDLQRCSEARLMHGIHDNELAKFTVEGKEIVLTRSEMVKGVSVEGVFVKNSIIWNCNLTKGSKIENSIVHQSSGKIIADYSYVESSVAPYIEAKSGVVHEAVDFKSICADREVISDVYRTKLTPYYHGRMLAPIGYDPKGMAIYQVIGKNDAGEAIYSDQFDETTRYFFERIPYNLNGAKEFSDETARTDDGRFTFEEIRRIDPRGINDTIFRDSLKSEVIKAISSCCDFE